MTFSHFVHKSPWLIVVALMLCIFQDCSIFHSFFLPFTFFSSFFLVAQVKIERYNPWPGLFLIFFFFLICIYIHIYFVVVVFLFFFVVVFRGFFVVFFGCFVCCFFM